MDQVSCDLLASIRQQEWPEVRQQMTRLLRRREVPLSLLKELSKALSELQARLESVVDREEHWYELPECEVCGCKLDELGACPSCERYPLEPKPELF